MGAQSVGSSRTEAVESGTVELTIKRARTRLQLLEALAVEIAALKRDPEAQRQLRPNDPADPETAHAVANITEWRRYLPEACISAMIRDGWHWST
jgi:hypothetical protein